MTIFAVREGGGMSEKKTRYIVQVSGNSGKYWHEIGWFKDLSDAVDHAKSEMKFPTIVIAESHRRYRIWDSIKHEVLWEEKK